MTRAPRLPLARTFLTLLTACFLIGGCGSDGFVFIAVNTGFVVSGDACDGQFNMRNNGGLTLLVVVGSGTPILLPSGVVGTCADITSGSQVSVRGPTQNGRVNATQVQLE